MVLAHLGQFVLLLFIVFSTCILYMNSRVYLLRCSPVVVLVLSCMEHIIQEVIDGPLISRGHVGPFISRGHVGPLIVVYCNHSRLHIFWYCDHCRSLISIVIIVGHS